MKNMRRKTLLLSAALLLAASHTFAQVSTEVINGLSYKINARTHTATLVGNEDNPYTGNIVVPETVTAQDGTDYSVTAFGEECFLGCIDLESVKIPSTVTTLGARCFMNCQTITEIDLPEGLKELPWAASPPVPASSASTCPPVSLPWAVSASWTAPTFPRSIFPPPSSRCPPSASRAA